MGTRTRRLTAPAFVTVALLAATMSALPAAADGGTEERLGFGDAWTAVVDPDARPAFGDTWTPTRFGFGDDWTPPAGGVGLDPAPAPDAAPRGVDVVDVLVAATLALVIAAAAVGAGAVATRRRRATVVG